MGLQNFAQLNIICILVASSFLHPARFERSGPIIKSMKFVGVFRRKPEFSGTSAADAWFRDPLEYSGFHAFNELNLVLAKVAHSGICVVWVTKAVGSPALTGNEKWLAEIAFWADLTFLVLVLNQVHK